MLSFEGIHAVSTGIVLSNVVVATLRQLYQLPSARSQGLGSQRVPASTFTLFSHFGYFTFAWKHFFGEFSLYNIYTHPGHYTGYTDRVWVPLQYVTYHVRLPSTTNRFNRLVEQSSTAFCSTSFYFTKSIMF